MIVERMSGTSIIISVSPCQRRTAVRNDQHHIDLFRRRFAEVAAAIGDQADRRGIFLSRLLDNVEWEYGWAVRLGLVKVEARTQQRTPKGVLSVVDRLGARQRDGHRRLMRGHRPAEALHLELVR